MSTKMKSFKKSLRSKVKSPSSKTQICDKHNFSVEEKCRFQSQLLQWYDSHKRKLPWRDIACEETDDNKRGYAIWVSEIMLQQTQVSTVIPYFNKWIKKWPSIHELSKASLEEVNKTWAGLGYYSRAKRLHEGAQILVKKRNGSMPQTPSDLKETIPGIGRYTASAISSIAYQHVTGVVDGNVVRVLSRVRIIGCDITKPLVQNHMWKLADDIVSETRPGDFNQALMELGAVICTPRNPKCEECPIQNLCLAYNMSKKNNPKIDAMVNKPSKKTSKKSSAIDIEDAHNCIMCISKDIWKSNPCVSTFPLKPKKKSSRQETVGVVVIQNNDKFLIIQRPETGLLAGLWEFPSVLFGDEISQKERNHIVTVFLEQLNFPPDITKNRQIIGEVLHIFSHIRTTYIVEHLMLNNFKHTELESENIKWMSSDEITTAAISTAMKKVFSTITNFCSKLNKSGTSNKRKRSPKEDTKQHIKQRSIKAFFT